MIAVFGLGFVGLASALAFAEKGFNVVGYDTNAERVDMLRAGKLPFHEPGLDEALVRHLGNKFTIADIPQDAVRNADIVYFCVGTPQGNDGAADLSHLSGAIAQALAGQSKERFRVLVTKSTIPPGTTSEKIAPLVESLGWRVGLEVGVANNPEFLREGSAWQDVFTDDRIVIGVEDERSAKMLERLYADFGAPVSLVSWNTGEFVKYISNTLFATLISYSNDVSRIADAIGGIDLKRAFSVLHQDRRWFGSPCNVATHYIYPGCGFGGYCLPKDVAALKAQGSAKGYDSPILAATLQVNQDIKEYVTDKVAARAVAGKPIGVLGLSFKEGSDDVRETPSKAIIEMLIAKGFSIVAHDPIANAEFKREYPNLPVTCVDSIDEVLELSGITVILTAWSDFKAVAEHPSVIDFRYIR
jgi:UDPglucose 6-dehydrogenase